MLLGLEFNNKKNEYMIECWLNPSNSILPTSSNQYHASNHLVGHFFEKINKNQQKSTKIKFFKNTTLKITRILGTWVMYIYHCLFISF
jgi:hypothetical protein